MTNDQVMAKILALPDPEMIGASKLDDPIGADRFYSARTVVKLLANERERCAKLCDKQAADCATWDEGTQKDGGRVASHMCAEAIRKD